MTIETIYTPNGTKDTIEIPDAIPRTKERRKAELE